MRFLYLIILTLFLIGCKADVQVEPEIEPEAVPEITPYEPEPADTLVVPESQEEDTIQLLEEKNSGSDEQGPLRDIKCYPEERKLTFTVVNPTNLFWQLDQDLPWPTPKGFATVAITLNSLEMNSQSMQYFNDELMFGPEKRFSDNCGGDAILQEGERTICTVYPVPLQDNDFDDTNELRVSAPGVYNQVTFTC